MYFGEPYVVDVADNEGTITIYTPTIDDIIKIGEQKFYSTLNIFIANTTSYKVLLWDLGKDWNDMSDFELFIMLLGGIDAEVSKLLFGDLDWTTFHIYQRDVIPPPKEETDEENKDEKKEKEPKEPEKELVLYSQVHNIEITERVYQHIHQYLQVLFNMQPEERFASRTLSKWLIDKEKRKNERDEKKDERKSSSLQSLISACVNHPGFKYKLEELREVTVAQFYDSVKRLQIYENTTAMLKGIMGGFVSAKDIKPDDYNFMRDI